MNAPFDFIIQLLSQFAGGPGPPENNLVRFGLGALFWSVLLAVTWNRQREYGRPREKLLVAGFAMAAFREIFMFSQQALRIVTGTEHDALCAVIAPFEHALSIAALVLIAGSFIRYLLDDARVARAYLLFGLGLAGTLSLLTIIWWPTKLAANPGMHFHSTWSAWALHLLAAVLLLIALFILARKTGWLRNVVVLALLLFIGSEIIVVFNLATARAYSSIICPIGNSLYLWAIPLFGYVYFREQSLEKKRAEQALQIYRDHLEELVDARTAELAQANAKLERTATLEERQRIAANLHDGLAQTLSYVNIISSQTETLLLKGDVVEATIEFPRIRTAVERAIAEVRQCIRSLREDPPPPQSLQEAMLEVIDDLHLLDGPHIRLDSHLSQPIFLDAIQIEEVKLVTREAVVNALQHAGASCIVVALCYEPDTFTATITDDGRGFDPARAPAPNSNHFGLSIMEARAARLGGTLHMDSGVDRGTCITLKWPGALKTSLQPDSVILDHLGEVRPFTSPWLNAGGVHEQNSHPAR